MPRPPQRVNKPPSRRAVGPGAGGVGRGSRREVGAARRQVAGGDAEGLRARPARRSQPPAGDCLTSDTPNWLRWQATTWEAGARIRRRTTQETQSFLSVDLRAWGPSRNYIIEWRVLRAAASVCDSARSH